jgi:hypothetical protein
LQCCALLAPRCACAAGCHVISNHATVTVHGSTPPAERQRALQAANLFANEPKNREDSNGAAPPANDEDVLLLT